MTAAREKAAYDRDDDDAVLEPPAKKAKGEGAKGAGGRGRGRGRK